MCWIRRAIHRLKISKKSFRYPTLQDPNSPAPNDITRPKELGRRPKNRNSPIGPSQWLPIDADASDLFMLSTEKFANSAEAGASVANAAVQFISGASLAFKRVRLVMNGRLLDTVAGWMAAR